MLPRRNDVLLGRGRPYQNFIGNRRMLRIVSQFKEQYNAKPRDQKRPYVETVLDEVLRDGTRFLQRIDGAGGSERWEEVGRAKAAEKVWHALRNKARTKNRSKPKSSQQEPSPPVTDPPAVAASNPATVAGAASGGHGVSSYNPDAFIPPTVGIPGIVALSREILQHLYNAAAASNLLATLTSPSPPPFPSQLQNLAAPNPVPSQQQFGTMSGVPTDGLLSPHMMANSNVLSGQSIPPSYGSLASYFLPSDAVHAGMNGVGAGVPPGNQSSQPVQASGQQPTNSNASSNGALIQALSYLIQAAQQGSAPPPT